MPAADAARPAKTTARRLAAASLRAFPRAPRATGALWMLTTAAQLVLDLGAKPRLASVAQREGDHRALWAGCIAVLAGYAGLSLGQALWARLALALCRGPGPVSLASIWRGLGGAWTRVGLLAGYGLAVPMAVWWPALVDWLAETGWAVDAARIALPAAAVAVPAVAWLALRLGLSLPAAAMGRLSTLGALRASWAATRGRTLLMVRTGLLTALPALAVMAVGLCWPALSRPAEVVLSVVQAGLFAAFGAAMPLFILAGDKGAGWSPEAVFGGQQASDEGRPRLP